MIFHNITIRNLFSFDNFSIDLDSRGITLIKGRNGSGKSNILRCISFCLFGNYGDEAVNQKVGAEGTVRLEGTHDGHSFAIVRCRKCREYKNNLYLTIDGNKVEAATNTDMQHKLESFLSLDLDTFNNIVSFSSDATMFAAAGDGTRKQIFEKLIHGLEIYTELCNKAKDKISEIDTALTSLKIDLSGCDREAQLTKKMIDDEGERAKNFEDVKQNKIVEIQKAIEELAADDIAPAIALWESKILRRENVLEKLDAAYDKYKTKWILLKSVEAEVCPNCFQRIDKHKDEIDDLWHKAYKIDVARNRIKGFITILTTEIRTKRTIEERRKKELKSLNFLLEETKNSVNEHARSYKRLRGNLLELTNKITVKTESQKEFEEEKLYYEELVRIFSKTGIPNAIISRYLDMLEQLTNNYLDVLSNGALGIRFTGTTKTKAGLSRNKIGIEVRSVSGVTEYSRYSGGQKQRVNIALLLALREIAKLSKGVDIKLLMLDEILDLSLDEAGVDDVLTLLESKSDIGSIFVLSPKDTFVANTARFSNVKTLTMLNGFTREV